jgi:DNA-binding IclR family transcriptional regulator
MNPVMANGTVHGEVSITGPKSRLSGNSLRSIEQELLNVVNVTGLEFK